MRTLTRSPTILKVAGEWYESDVTEAKEPPAACHMPPTACHLQPAIRSLTPAAPAACHLQPFIRHLHTCYLQPATASAPNTSWGCMAEARAHHILAGAAPQVHQILAQAAWHCLKYTKYQQVPHGRASSIPNNRRGCMVEAQIHQIQQGLNGRGSNKANTTGAKRQKLKYTKYWQGLV